MGQSIDKCADSCCLIAADKYRSWNGYSNNTANFLHHSFQKSGYFGVSREHQAEEKDGESGFYRFYNVYAVDNFLQLADVVGNMLYWICFCTV